MKTRRIATGGGAPLTHNPFAALDGLDLPPGREPSRPAEIPPPSGNRGRVDVIRQKAHRGGKTVTVVTGFVGIGLPEKQELARRMRKTGGVGGTVKDGNIEVQGDQRKQVVRILREAGFRPVLAGG